MSALAVPEVFSTSAHDERAETDPSRALSMREIFDLRWRFCEVESDLGIRSTFGEQLEGALACRPSDDSVRAETVAKALRTKLQRGWKPKTPVDLSALEDAGLGLSGALYGADGNFQRTAKPLTDSLSKSIADACSEQRIHMRTPLRTPPSTDLRDEQSFLFLVRRLREIDRRRRLISRSHDRILEAVYGNSTCGDDTQAFRKRYGDLSDVVVAIVNSRREPNDAPARTIVRASLTSDPFVRSMKQAAGAYLREACNAYAETGQ